MSFIRSIRRVAASSSFAGRRTMMTPAVARRPVVLAAAVAITGATMGTAITDVKQSSANNTRSRSVAHVASSSVTAVVQKKSAHWSSDLSGLNAEQRVIARVDSPDAIVRVQHATTRDLLNAACAAPGIRMAKLTSEADASSASSSVAAEDERVFLSKMQAEYGAGVLPLLRRQEWNLELSSSSAAQLVCYFQEGTQRILFRRLSM